MSNKKYKKICYDLLSDLNDRQKEIMVRRFGLGEHKPETLDSIGKDFGVCRERIRQIEAAGFNKIKPKANKHKSVFESFKKHLKSYGGLRKEDVLLSELGEDEHNEVYFLLNLNDSFLRINKKNDFHSVWVLDEKIFEKAKDINASLCSLLKKAKKPVHLKDFKSQFNIKEKALVSYIEASTNIGKNKDSFYGLAEWPEINPRGVKDKAYLTFKRQGKPLHFRELAELIEGTHVQTLHNELIKDDRFILVGRGTYALAEWGYYPGQVKDVIARILKEAQGPLTKSEIVERVLGQRMVKENTIVLNLGNKQYFSRDSKGKYTIKEA